MIWTTRCRVSAGLMARLALVAFGVAGCSALDTSDPTAVEEEELNDADGAELIRGDALRRLYDAVGQGAVVSALMSDEYISDPPSNIAPGTWYEEMLDRRQSEEAEQSTSAASQYGRWHEVRRAASIAIPKLRAYAAPGVRDARIAEMYAVRGYATMRLAEDFCPGFPLHELDGFTLVYGPPLGTDAVFERAIADFDSAVALAGDSIGVLDFARIGRARALLGRGEFGAAAAAVAGIATAYVRNAEFSASDFRTRNPAGVRRQSGGGRPIRGVGDQEGGTGLDFVSADDPRLETAVAGLANDGVTTLYAPVKYATGSEPIVMASGVQARLIEAEAALDAGGSEWLTILNDLRADPVAPPGLSPLADPGTHGVRVDLLFRERAFWLYGTGHRLADLRRLVARYGRAADSAFPSGAYRLGGGYADGTSIPFPAASESQFSPDVTGCTSR